MKSTSKGYVPKIPTTQLAVSTYNGLCCTPSLRSWELKAMSMNTSIKSSGSIAGWSMQFRRNKRRWQHHKIAWNELDAYRWLQWSSWGPSWWHICWVSAQLFNGRRKTHKISTDVYNYIGIHGKWLRGHRKSIISEELSTLNSDMATSHKTLHITCLHQGAHLKNKLTRIKCDELENFAPSPLNFTRIWLEVGRFLFSICSEMRLI